MGRKRKADSVLDLDNDRDSTKDCREDDPIQRNAANARERARMRVLSKAFTKLKTTLPWVPPDTKLSKLDTLRLASCYIAHLRQILTDDNSENSPVMAGIAARDSLKHSTGGAVHPVTLTWPFSFNGSPGARPNEVNSFTDCGTFPGRMVHSKTLTPNKTS